MNLIIQLSLIGNFDLKPHLWGLPLSQGSQGKSGNLLEGQGKSGKLEIIWEKSGKSHGRKSVLYMLIFTSSIKTISLKLGFTPCKAQQPLQGMVLEEK